MKIRFASVAALFLAACAQSSLDPSPANTPRDLVAADDIRSDFERLYEGLQGAHINLYAHRPKPEYDALYEMMQDGFQSPMSQFDAQVAFQTFTAFGNVAHARIDFPADAYQAFLDAGGESFPIYLRIHEERAYVGENLSGLDILQPGMEITHLDGRPMSEWLDRAARHVSADTPYIAHSLLEFSFPSRLWLEVGETDGMDVTYHATPGVSANVFVPFTSREMQQAAATASTDTFVLDSSARIAEILDSGEAYLRPGPFYNAENPEEPWRNEAFVTFIDMAFENFIAAGSDTLIIDLRDNPGGDSSFSDPMVSWIADEPFRFASRFIIRSSPEAQAANAARIDANPDAAEGVSGTYAERYAEVAHGETFDFDIPVAQPREDQRFDGDVYVLINRHSFSNAVNVAAMVQDYGFGTIVGEMTSDMATTFGAMETFTLPTTGIEVGFPKAHIIRPNGNTKTAGVAPDWTIASPVAPKTSDSVLQALLARLEDEDSR